MIEINIENDGITPGLLSIVDRLKDLRPVFNSFGAHHHRSTMDRFNQNPWNYGELTEQYRNSRRKLESIGNGLVNILDGTMKNDIDFWADKDMYTTGTSVVYGGIQQERFPFLEFNDKDQEVLSREVLKYLVK